MMFKEEILELIEDESYEMKRLQELIDETKNCRKCFYDKYNLPYVDCNDYDIIIEALIARKMLYEGKC